MKSILNLKNIIAIGLILFGVLLSVQTLPKPDKDDENVVVLDIK